jgi:hypothetical protein
VKISRLDLDGVGSPRRLAERIHETEDLSSAVPIDALCEALDIQSIREVETTAFEAALITDQLRSEGHILISERSPRRRKRFSTAHELGHFLIEAHQPPADGRIECTLGDLHMLDPRARDRRRRMESEANLFAADLLMPPKKIRMIIGQSGVSLESLIAIAHEFDVSKEALARAFVAAHREPVAVILSRNHRVERFYRHDDFPYLPIASGKPLPLEAIAVEPPRPGETSDTEEVDPETWVSERDVERTLLLTEQVIGQRNGYAMTLLQADLDDEG